MTFWRTLRLAIRFSLREMRGGLSGFAIFIACIALGVAAIGGVNSVARSIQDGVAGQGQVLLGADLRFELNQREAEPAEHRFLAGLGTLAESASMRSMARLEDGSDQTLVEVKAVDAAYPLYGALETEPALSRDELLGRRGAAWGAVAPDLFFERLGLAPGARIRLGNTVLELRARLVEEPDAVSEGFGFAPRLLVSLDALRDAGLVQPGSMVEFAYKIRLPQGAGEAELSAIRERAGSAFPEAGWSIRSRTNAAPALSSNIERFSQFLTLVGLTALVVGGVGVANAVKAYLDGKRAVIATFKSLGASGGFVFAVYLVQIVMIAAVGIAVGLAIGALMPFAAGAALSSVIPVPATGGVYPEALGLAALFGLLVTLVFALLPLGRARDVPATALFREAGFESRGLPRLVYVVASLGFGGRAGAAGRRRRRRAAHRRHLRRRHLRLLRRAAHRRLAGAAGGQEEPQGVLDGAPAGHRQHPPARRADAVGGAVAGARADAARHAGVDRRQSAPADRRQPAGAGSQLLLRRRPGQRRRCVLGAGGARGAGWRAGARADAARPGDGAERRRRAEDQRAAGGRLGAARRPRHHLFRPVCRRTRRSPPAAGGRRAIRGNRWSPFRPRRRENSGSRSATRSPSTCWGETSPRASPTCGRWNGSRWASTS